MSNFSVSIQKIYIRNHPNADSLEIGNIGTPDGWQVVVKKGLYTSGNLVAYIGENAVVPEWVLKMYGFWNEEKNKGMLAGSNGDRVKGVKLRDEFSLGICIPVKCHFGTCVINVIGSETNLEVPYIVHEGYDVTELLGVTKYEAPIPVAMAGEVFNGGTNIGVNYDIENIESYPNALQDGEEVQITEKIHGTLGMCTLISLNNTSSLNVDEAHSYGYTKFCISSKGLGAKGLFFKDNEANANNVYVRTFLKHTKELELAVCFYDDIITIVGEVFGDSIQDLHYGMKNQTDFRVFDVYIGRRGMGRYLNDDELDKFCENTGMIRVPILYRGEYSKTKVLEFSQNTKSVFDPNQIREGVVIKPTKERYLNNLGRVVLKSINEKYRTRKNGTEYN